MKSLINLLAALLADASRSCSVETARDLAYARFRAQHEGISFLTITLPNFAEDFERSLDEGRVSPTAFSGWRKTGCLPKFLSGFTGLVFDDKGVLRHDANISAVSHVRQITRFFKKLRVPCSDAKMRKAFKKFVNLEASFHEDPPFLCDIERLEHFARVCDVIWTDVFRSGGGFNPLDLVPKHGPGATAERISGNAKFSHKVWYNRLEEVFPASDYIFTSINHLIDDDTGINTVSYLCPEEEHPVRVVAVPKTLKAPRIIAIEPVCMQYAQQAVSSFLVTSIEKSPMVNGSIRFTDQSINQGMALRASKSLTHSTLDLSDASDRVRLEHVQVMLRSVPDILDAVIACRSSRAQVPEHDTPVVLRKYASMGSALCFPIEAMYFYSVIVHSLLWERGNRTPESLDVRGMSRGRYIFGDDIIVRKDETDSVVKGLTLFGCKVNTSKSFSGCSFRESCGVDAFRGVDVTPVYLRETQPCNARSTARVLSWVSTSNQLHLKGCWQTAQLMRASVERVMGRLPVLCDTSPGLGWISFQGVPSPSAYCLFTHVPIVRTYTVRTIKERDALDGYPALLKFFLRSKEGSSQPSRIDKNHLLFSVRRCAVSRKRTWVAVA